MEIPFSVVMAAFEGANKQIGDMKTAVQYNSQGNYTLEQIEETVEWYVGNKYVGYGHLEKEYKELLKLYK